MKFLIDLNSLKINLHNNMREYFPPVKYIFAYGSAVIPQKGHIGNMIDTFLIVENISNFHKHNLEINKNNYSYIAVNCKLSILNKINNFGTGVFYNTNIKLNKDILIKYGVISELNFKYHLENWENMFIAGRFHKPVLGVKSDSDIDKVIYRNREAAFALCLLKNPKKMLKEKLLIDIAEISYLGDIRTYMKAEKKNKIFNVVLGAFDEYLNIYGPIMNKYCLKSNENEDYIIQDEYNMENLYDLIPKKFLGSLKIFCNNYENEKEFKKYFLYKLNHTERKYLIEAYLKKLNLKYSIYGILSGIFTTDVHKSVNN